VRKQAFFIIGPESSGTRMLTKAFLSLGMYGDGGHGQRLDKQGFAGGHRRIAFRRSVPHGKKMPKIAELVRKMEKAGYTVRPVVIVRDKDMCAQSQVKNHHQKAVEDARESIKKAVEHIYRELAQVGKSPNVVYYEPFVKFKRVRRAFFRRFKLPHPKMDFYNANEKYAEGCQTCSQK
jgi:hypothetical protein